MRFIVFWLVSLLLAACSTPQLPITEESHRLAAKLQQQNRGLMSWDMVASTAFTNKDSSYSLTAFWQQNEDEYSIRFDAPFNTGVLKIKGHAGFSELILDNKKTIQGVSPEQLIAQATTFNIPVTGLTQWIRGIPHQETQYLIGIKANGDTETIEQDGWLIRYDDWDMVSINAHTYRLPNTLRLKQGDINIKISPSQWLLTTPKKNNSVFSDLDF